MDDKIIPFGKHKGKPVEILSNDKQYTDWLLSQSWFRDKYVNLYNVIINNFREPVDTPEHNNIQIKFLKQEYRLKIAYLVNPNLFYNSSKRINEVMRRLLDTEENEVGKYFLDALQNPKKESEFGFYDDSMLKMSQPVFERVDVAFSIWYGIFFHFDNYTRSIWSRFNLRTETKYFIEIKPTVSDDYPAILRQMKASMPNLNGAFSDNFHILLVGEYNGKGASRNEFISFFETQGFKVIFKEDLDNVELPEFDKKLKLDTDLKQVVDKANN